jgi:hypothetical protein
MSEGTVRLFGAAARLGVVLAELRLVDVRVIHDLHIVVGQSTLLVFAAVFVALDTIIPNLIQIATKFILFVSKVAQQSIATSAVSQHTLQGREAKEQRRKKK